MIDTVARRPALAGAQVRSELPHRAAAVGLAAVLVSLLLAVPARADTAHTAYVSDHFSHDLTPIDTQTNTAGTPIGIGDENWPRGLAITPNAETAYVTSDIPHTVIPIDIATNTVGTAIRVGNFPIAIAITPDGKTAYVPNVASNDVTPIDIATNTAGTPIAVAKGPDAIAITPDGKTAYVSSDYNDRSNKINRVTPIDTATNTAGTPIEVATGPWGIAITPDGETAYVVSYDARVVTPIDTATNTAGTPIAVGAAPEALAITPDGATAYVANSKSNDVTPIDIATNTAGPPIGVGTSPVAIAIAPDGKTAYVTNYNDKNVTPIDTATNIAGTPITVGKQPGGIAITPDQAPTAAFSVGSATIGQPTSFDASASSASPGQTVTTYRWNFGDGTTQTTRSPATTHTYDALGTHTATLTVADDARCSTDQIFTGQTVSCNGSPAAQITHQATVAKASPSISTNASRDVALGRAVHDTANLTGAYKPTGELKFRLYRPSDSSCSQAPMFTNTVSVAGKGAYRSANFTPTRFGVYRWTATYSGDASNTRAAGACNAANESVTVTKAGLGGGANSGVTIHYRKRSGLHGFVFGPNPKRCSAGRNVRVFRQKGNEQNRRRDVRMGSDTAHKANSGKYRWHLKVRNHRVARGKYYARAAQIPGCQRDRSRTIHAKRP
jgi:YVTN family beta-propeller protein